MSAAIPLPTAKDGGHISPPKRITPQKPSKPDFLKSSKAKPNMPSLPDAQDYALTEAQKAQFLEHGFIKVEKCFTKAQAAEFTSMMWTRLGFDPNDKSTWTTERSHMSSHNSVSIAEFAPKAWSAMSQLLGGEDRISKHVRGWNDGFIVNLGKEEFNPEDELKFRELWGWHNDGDFFVHFLDSPEQALLVIPLWSDIVPRGGGTVICTDGIKHIAKLLVFISISKNISTANLALV
jgi:hypothetical protein